MKRFRQEDILAFPRSPRREILRNGRSLRLKLAKVSKRKASK
jgi:hypothetical protein